MEVTPRYVMLGGILGALITYTVVRSMSGLGPAQASILIVVSQIVVAYCIELFGLFGVSRFAIDTNPLMVGGLTLGLSTLFLIAAYVSARKVKRVDVRELVEE